MSAHGGWPAAPTTSLPCAGHPLRSAVCRCGTCGAPLCDACFEHLIDAYPACARCGYELATRQQRSISLALTLTGAAVGGAGWLFSRGHLQALPAALAGAAGVVLAALIALWVRSGRGGELEKRDREAPHEPPPERAPRHPYRQRARHLAMRLSPKISGAGTALALGVSFVLAAAIFPTALSLPRWLEAEIVLGVCWLLMTSALSLLLYRGYRLKDDYLFVSPFGTKPAPPASPSPAPAPTKEGKSSSLDLLSGCDCSSGCSFDGEGGMVLLLIVLGALLLGGAAWVVVEIALPVVVFVAYTLLLSAMKHVAHDRHGCEGSLARSVGWGALWAALFVAPLGLVVAAVHVALPR